MSYAELHPQTVLKVRTIFLMYMYFSFIGLGQLKILT